MTSFSDQRLETLVLARLSVVKRAARAAKIRESLFAFVEAQLAPAEWQSHFDRLVRSLREQHLVEPDDLSLTAHGRKRLEQQLGLKGPPIAKTWPEFVKKYLPRLFLPNAADHPVSDPALLLLARRLQTATPSEPTPESLTNAWLRNAYGIRSNRLTLEALRAALLARELGIPPQKRLSHVVRIGAARLAGSPKADGLSLLRALTAQWLAGPAAEAPSPPTPNGGANKVEPSNADLVSKIKVAAESPQARRFGADKVFISSVWDSLRRDAAIASLGEQGFKQRLVEAHRNGLLVLTRADLVAAMDPQDVAASETRHLNATYHFIQV